MLSHKISVLYHLSQIFILSPNENHVSPSNWLDLSPYQLFATLQLSFFFDHANPWCYEDLHSNPYHFIAMAFYLSSILAVTMQKFYFNYFIALLPFYLNYYIGLRHCDHLLVLYFIAFDEGCSLNTINLLDKQRNNKKYENKIWISYYHHKCKIIEFTNTIY